MDQVDAIAANDLGDAAPVPPEPDRILRGRREELQLRARVAQPLHEPAALAQDDGAAARALDRLGDLDGRKLGPSGIELGDDLQYGRALCGQEALRGQEASGVGDREPQFLRVGDGGAPRRIAYLADPPAKEPR